MSICFRKCKPCPYDTIEKITGKIYRGLDQYIKDKTYKGFKNEMKLIIRAGTISDSID